MAKFMRFSATLLLACLTWIPSIAQLSITLAADRPQATLGEPLTFWYVATNEGKTPLVLPYDLTLSVRNSVFKVIVEGPVSPECRPELDYAGWRAHAHICLTSGERKAGGFEALVAGISSPGQYNVWVEYDSTKVSSDWDTIKASRICVQSNKIRVAIIEPTGPEEAVFRLHHNKCNQLTLEAQGILSLSPTSTYAGYVLAEKVPDYSDPLFHPVPPEEQLKQCRNEGKTFVTFPDKAFEEYFHQLDRFMKGGRVPESLRASLWCFYGDQLVRRGRFPEAEQAFSEAAKGTEPGDPKEKAYWHRAQESLKAFGTTDGKSVESPPGKSPTPPNEPAPAKPAPAPPAPPAPAKPPGGGP